MSIKRHCDFCQYEISGILNSGVFMAQDKNRYRFLVELSRISNERKRGVRWEKTDCCFKCLCQFMAELIDKQKEAHPCAERPPQDTAETGSTCV
jgi:hypothetical protein